MAKKVYEIQGQFDEVYKFIKKSIIGSSMSASIEEEETLSLDEVNIGIIVFERYSYTGDNRLSLQVTIIEKDQNIKIIGISSGGSNGVIFKINTFGEGSFLLKLDDAITEYKLKNKYK